MNSREIALNVVNRVLNEGAYSNLVLSKELNESDLNDKDKGLVTELVYGTLRRKNTLDTIISNFVRDINDTSIEANSILSSISSGVTYRIFVFSIQTTLSSFLSFHASCP